MHMFCHYCSIVINIDNKKIVPVKDIAQVQHSPSNNFTKAKCMEWSESQVKVWLEDNKLHEISDK